MCSALLEGGRQALGKKGKTEKTEEEKAERERERENRVRADEITNEPQPRRAVWQSDTDL